MMYKAEEEVLEVLELKFSLKRMKIIVATDEEYNLVRKYLPEFDVLQTGVGASNVINKCCDLSSKVDVINIGFCGSNNLKIGSVVTVSKTYRLLTSNIAFKDYRNGYVLSDTGYPCYTSNEFVTKTDIKEDCVFDMELNYLAAFNFNLLGAVKIVSDNLSVWEYEQSVDIDDKCIWDEVKRQLYQIIGTKVGII